MQAKNSEDAYGWMAILLHWLVAVTIVGLFALGFWMVDLSYYDPWYRQGPDIHRSVGILLFMAMVLRLVWRLFSPTPRPLPNHKRWEVVSAHLAHGALYLLIFVAMISGYLISTADGSAIHVFDWFQVPSVTGQLIAVDSGQHLGWKTPDIAAGCRPLAKGASRPTIRTAPTGRCRRSGDDRARSPG